MMIDIAKLIQTEHIDSFQKLRLLIFFHEHPESSWTSQQISKRLYLADVPLLEEMIADLQSAGLIDCAANRCKLSDDVCIRSHLQSLVKICEGEDPLARQEILDRVRQRPFATARFQVRAHDTR
jgi:hypothetical protein